MIKLIIAILFSGIFNLTGKGDENYYYENAIYDENIKTVLMYRDGYDLSNPVWVMGEETPLVLKFDDLSGDVKNYYYTVIHCDSEWNESFIFQTDYIEGFPENPLDDYARSFNTAFEYINYRL
ncbi:MAG: DUF5103 domain-containing protein, partial [Prolixibacteraceae bacterium]|nr:DUF5103 domain-containing protein [Prolixibacteraceae bacterium]